MDSMMPPMNERMPFQTKSPVYARFTSTDEHVQATTNKRATERTRLGDPGNWLLALALLAAMAFFGLVIEL
jgi:hypothetical protein